MVNVSLIKGDDRKKNIDSALKLIKKDIKSNLKNKTPLIKPNFVSTSVQLASTNVESAEAVLEFFSKLGKKRFIIAEGSAGNTKKGFENFNFYKLKDNYNIHFIDLNKDKYRTIKLNFPKHPIKIRVAKTLFNKNNYIISLAKLKTHDSVIATLSLKNLLMGSIQKSLIRNDKSKMHQGYEEINNYLALLAKKIMPHLAIIDGFTGMEENGPIHGKPIDTKISIASTDSIAADRVGLACMQINPKKIGYLTLASRKKLGEYNLKRIRLLGNSIKDCKKQFTLHFSAEQQMKWLENK